MKENSLQKTEFSNKHGVNLGRPFIFIIWMSDAESVKTHTIGLKKNSVNEYFA